MKIKDICHSARQTPECDHPTDHACSANETLLTTDQKKLFLEGKLKWCPICTYKIFVVPCAECGASHDQDHHEKQLCDTCRGKLIEKKQKEFSGKHIVCGDQAHCVHKPGLSCVPCSYLSAVA
jgi:hypothetical protein